ncbi:hypothetical protein HS088_TW22G01039 [Tripterygium wilfordii]|uniref:Uncharacterized protein n=1 Tax=Tripterygium wilfordii TaxID=458696 RepID=A0A7J7C0P2_TRIWF|nr:protein OCTOPUS-like [Tripterygium wilfordii]KAF5727346.1 hypothetical protein HS088_TW22G01039 [Tripterygium wilfordii]
MTRPQSHRRLSTCHRHVAEPVTGFCASCLRERLASIDSDTRHETSTSIISSTVLRRSKSYSASRAENPEGSSVAEPRRKSCDVGSGSTLSDLFSLDDKRRRLRGSNLGYELKEVEENEEEIRVSDNINRVENARAINEEVNVHDDFEEDGGFKTMKEFIDLEWDSKKNRRDLWEIAGNFLGAASIFSKKLRKWRQKQKSKQQHSHDSLVEVEKAIVSVNQLRETQSEIGENGFGRRSCDTDARLSLDLGRISFDEPRASWDGCLIGKPYPRLTPLVPVEEKGNLSSEGERSPGGTAQTRDYYGDSLNPQRRRRSFDHSGWNMRVGLGDVDNANAVPNAKMSPETVGLFHGAKLLITEKELRDSNWYSFKDYSAESAKAAGQNAGSYVGEDVYNVKKSRKWLNLRSIWGLMHRSESKCGHEAKAGEGTVADGSLAESWQKLRRVANGEANEAFSDKLMRSYSVSTRNLCKLERTCTETKDKQDDLVLQRNRSSRYSPNTLDNGLLRFYLTPLRGNGRSKAGNSRSKDSQSMARSCKGKINCS